MENQDFLSQLPGFDICGVDIVFIHVVGDLVTDAAWLFVLQRQNSTALSIYSILTVIVQNCEPLYSILTPITHIQRSLTIECHALWIVETIWSGSSEP